MADWLTLNRRNWDERVPIHARDTTGYYRVKEFLAGADTLYPIESAAIGDVSGRRVLHLQCHFGLDTLSLARRGAVVTGVDFSPAAIALAREITNKSGLPARFIEANVYDAAKSAGSGYDLVYTTWGTIVWLPDVAGWAQVIAETLGEGGRLYFLDTHPAAETMEEVDGRLIPTYRWRTPADAPLVCEGGVTYTGDDTRLAASTTHEWIHPVSDILSALIDAGLTITSVHEHDHLPDRRFPMMIDTGDRMFALPTGTRHVPLALSIEATKDRRRRSRNRLGAR
jgi:SAM-dependent methyltransferase